MAKIVCKQIRNPPIEVINLIRQYRHEGKRNSEISSLLKRDGHLLNGRPYTDPEISTIAIHVLNLPKKRIYGPKKKIPWRENIFSLAEQMRGDGYRWKEIADFLNASGSKNKHGREWTGNGLITSIKKRGCSLPKKVNDESVSMKNRCAVTLISKILASDIDPILKSDLVKGIGEIIQ